jgi:hypothetical protein
VRLARCPPAPISSSVLLRAEVRPNYRRQVIREPSSNTWLGTRGRKASQSGHNLLIRLRDYRDDVLRFLTDFTVPFTNNQAERDLRMMKLCMKISGTFRTLEGAQIFADTRSVISTVRKHGGNILETLTLSPQNPISAGVLGSYKYFTL